MSLARYFETFVTEHKDRDVQICLIGGGPMHGRISAIDDKPDDPNRHVYKIVCEAQLGQNTRAVTMPFIFAGGSVLWMSPGPITSEGPTIVGPVGRGDRPWND